MKNVKWSVEMRRQVGPVKILGVFNFRSEAENFILEKCAPNSEYSEELGGWSDSDSPVKAIYMIKMVPM